MNRLPWVLALAVLFLGCISYKPAPVDLQSQAAALESRSLADPGLKAYLERCEGHSEPDWPRTRWDFDGLTAAALYFSPAVAQARSELERARAGAYAAGLRQDPSLVFTNQYQSNATGGLSPWTSGPALDVPLTTAGKRGIRQAQAAEHVRETEFLLAGAFFNARSALRAALVAWQFAGAREENAARVVEAREQSLAALDAALAAGEVSKPDVEAARAEADAARLALSSARQARATARAELAGALGLPVSALEGVAIEALAEDAPHLPDKAEALRAALTGRSDVMAALCAYAASDQALRLAIAEQYPDLHLQPGYLWDQGAVRWELGLSLALPLLNRNRGGIAQAEAERAAAGQRVIAVQAKAMKEVEAARAGYEASLEGAERARSQAQARQRALDAVSAAVAAGEEDRLALALARASLATARLDGISAEQEVQSALGRLEDALERPLSPAAALPPPPEKETP